jgi:uncharacterized membrane protein YhaH (DUF805 family)
MSNPTPGSDPNSPQGNQGQPSWGAPQQPGYGAPQQPQYGAPQQPGYGAPQQGYGAPQQPGYPPQGYAPAPSYSGGPGGATPQLGFPEAVMSVLNQYANFSGRARRSEYWWFYLATFLASIVAAIIDAVIGVSILQWILLLAVIVPTLAVGARRLHDTDRSGWWQLIGIVPLVGIIVLIVFFVQDSNPGPNRYGPSPKYPAAGY